MLKATLSCRHCGACFLVGRFGWYDVILTVCNNRYGIASVAGVSLKAAKMAEDSGSWSRSGQKMQYLWKMAILGTTITRVSWQEAGSSMTRCAQQARRKRNTTIQPSHHRSMLSLCWTLDGDATQHLWEPDLYNC